MKVIFTEIAEFELSDTIIYYEFENPGLGKRFKKEIYASIKRIACFPTAWSLEIDNIRKYIMHKFPYKILYSIEKDHLLIIAIAHQHRKPDYWTDRQKI